MTTDPVWPSGAAEIVLLAEVIAVWILSTYAIAPTTRESRDNANPPQAQWLIAVAVLVAGLSGWLLPPPGTNTSTRLLLSALVATVVAAQAIGRQKLADSERRKNFAEWEIAASAVLVFTSAAIIGLGTVGSPIAGSIVRSGKIAAILCMLSAAAFVFRCGTYIVRGVLDKANATPRIHSASDGASAPHTLNVSEFNRGRAIGNLERLLMIMLISLGSYEALGFLVAAKGLIRAPEFEDRDFAEYFILGSLASVAVALVVGIVLRVSIPHLWMLQIENHERCVRAVLQGPRCTELSIAVQRDDRADARGATGREPCRRRRGGDQRDSDRGERQRIGR
jgi:hypothetical protein